VSFELIPAIDVHRGRLARLDPIPPASVRYLPGDPVEIAAAFAEAGARWIHVVDLEASLGEGVPADLRLLERVAGLPVQVEAGGGLSEEGVRLALGHGAARAVLGAAALAEPDTVERAVAEHGDRVAVGLDVRSGWVAPRGAGGPGPPVEVAIERLAAARPAMLVYTDADRDGSLGGPDLEGPEAVAEAVGVPVLASGGVGSVDDLLALSEVRGVAGAIVGRAIHEGRVDLRSALEALAGSG
jgi:phosphoribosylformimino-5-aminoimidazole carboxamide ribonucleotide (ProFAR) isomerase